jgi:RNA polymerase sigma-70 factor (ECF subfamily)
VDLLPPVAPSLPPLDREQLARCMQTLKERERTVVVMTFYDERTGADVAGFLGISAANVRVIRHRAIHQLRECMGARA